MGIIAKCYPFLSIEACLKPVLYPQQVTKLESWPWSASCPAYLEGRGGHNLLSCTAMAGAAKLRATVYSSSLYSKNRHHSNHARLAGPKLYVTLASFLLL
jgi:hypothetical protein